MRIQAQVEDLLAPFGILTKDSWPSCRSVTPQRSLRHSTLRLQLRFRETAVLDPSFGVTEQASIHLRVARTLELRFLDSNSRESVATAQEFAEGVGPPETRSRREQLQDYP